MKQGMLQRQPLPGFLAVLSLALMLIIGAPVVVAGTLAAAGNATVVIVSGDRQEESLAAALRVVESPLDRLLPEHFLDAPEDLIWQKPGRDGFHPGISSSRWWLRIDLRNVDSTALARVIVIRQPSLDDVRFALLCNDGYVEAGVSGDSRKFSERRIPDRNPAFDFMLPARSQCTALFTIKSLETVQFPAVIADPVSYNSLQQRDNMLRAVALGMQALFLVIMMLAALVLRTATAWLLTLVIVSQALLIVVFSGIGYQFLWGELPELQRGLTAPAVAITWVLTSLLCIRMLGIDTIADRSHARAVLALIRATWWIALTATLLHIFLPDTRFVAAVIGASALGMLVLLALTAGSLLVGDEKPGLVAAAVLAVTLGALVEASGFLGLIPLGGNFLLVLQGAFLIETALLGAAMLRPMLAAPTRPRGNPQPQPLDREVNRRVAERTHELAIALARLQSTNQQLDRLSSTDALTGTWNRRHMDQYLDHYRATAHTPAGTAPEALSFILFDVDFFKEVNDRYGHPVGDRCLRAIADCVQQQLRIGDDLLCRYGGEEFAVILPDTDLDAAQKVAEKIRRAVEDIRICCTPNIELQVTVSLGVSTLGREPDVGKLVGDADLALYKAKNKGRNRWQIAGAA